MSESSATDALHRRSGTLRALIACALFAAPIILGLLSMHVLGMHAMGPMEMAAAQSVTSHSTMPTADHDGGASAGDAGVGTPPVGVGTPPVGDGTPLIDPAATSANGVMAAACPNCSVGDPMTMALGCTLALLFVALALALPRLLPRWLHRPALTRFDGRTPESSNSAGSAPSLTALCISRT